MSITIRDVAILCGRSALAYVYMYAGYLNAKSENRDWLFHHTAFLFPPHTSRTLVVASAIVGVVMMLAGGILILFGLANWLGCATLMVFTLFGYFQHRKEVEFAAKIADSLSANLESHIVALSKPELIRADLLDQRVSAYRGQFSSGLKNVGLIGALAILGVTGAGAISLDHYLTKLGPNSFVDLVAWPM
jgi:uncharacterized membrane protein YphA (DoxX/SURF4 family)